LSEKRLLAYRDILSRTPREIGSRLNTEVSQEGGAGIRRLTQALEAFMDMVVAIPSKAVPTENHLQRCDDLFAETRKKLVRVEFDFVVMAHRVATLR